MWDTGTISGTVLDEAGDPLVLTPVRALVRSYRVQGTTLDDGVNGSYR